MEMSIDPAVAELWVGKWQKLEIATGASK